jgi:glycosyltransferase involved in cell wall biosynthesis
VDRPRFRRADTGRRAETFARFGIDPSRRLFLNVRRFLPIWGCDVALEAFRRYARVDPGAHFVMLGGSGTEGMVREARKTLCADGLEGRFTLFEGDTPYDDCIDLMAVADVFLSLMRVPDMRSASILQAAYAGGIPVLSDQAEYREMERDGFRALFVDPVDPAGVVAALRECTGESRLAGEFRVANERYIDEHEDHEIQMARLREAIEEVCGKYGV